MSKRGNNLLKMAALIPGISNLEAYLWATPNSRRVSILFETLGLEYRVHPVDIRAQEQFSPEILALNPFAKLPIVAWTEADAQHVMTESGAIMLHFCRHAPDLLPVDGPPREAVLVWFMTAMTSIGPMTGNAHHWTSLAPERPTAAANHHMALVRRAYSVLERQLATHDYLAGAYSLADIAAYPWVAVHDWAKIDLGDYPAIESWMIRVAERPAVIRGMQVPDGASLA